MKRLFALTLSLIMVFALVPTVVLTFAETNEVEILIEDFELSTPGTTLANVGDDWGKIWSADDITAKGYTGWIGSGNCARISGKNQRTAIPLPSGWNTKSGKNPIAIVFDTYNGKTTNNGTFRYVGFSSTTVVDDNYALDMPDHSVGRRQSATLRFDIPEEMQIADNSDLTYMVVGAQNTNDSMLIDNIRLVYNTDEVRVSQEAPSAPTISEVSEKYVVLNEVEGCVYSCDGETWQASPKFNVLDVNADSYAFYQKYYETDTAYASPVSEPLVIEKEEQNEVPDAPVVVADGGFTVTLEAVEGCEYSSDGVTWQSSNEFTNLAGDTTYTFYQRYAATINKAVGPISEGTVHKTAPVFLYEAESVVGAYSGSLSSNSSNTDGVTGSQIYVVHDSSNPAVGDYVEFNFDDLTPGYYTVTIRARQTSARSAYDVIGTDETGVEQNFTFNFADLSTGKLTGTQYYYINDIDGQVCITSGSSLKLKFVINNAGTSGTFIDKFVLTKVAEYEVEEDPLAVDVETQSGASIRLGNVNGIRFYTTVDVEKIDELIADGAVVEMGTLIAPVDLVNSELSFDMDESKYVDVKYDYGNGYYDGQNEIVGSIVNIKEANIARDFVARGYVKVTKDGITTISYSEYDVSTARSLKTVAIALKNDTENTSLYEQYQAQVDEWAAAPDYLS